MGFILAVTISAVLLTAGAIVLVYAINPAEKEKRRNKKAPVLSGQARVVDKRTDVIQQTHVNALHSSNPAIPMYSHSMATRYYVTFELEDRRRLEIPVSGEASGQLSVGDTGVLTWQGTQFHSFQREVLR
ncbi:MAG: DUF2500 domain-containing protein [Propionibacteriaceae bacterium]|nr:DUF2500 domain-containing protein [Propionibacteriaceae bacterium]